MKFADPANYEILVLSAKHAVAHEQFGIALKCINKAVEEKSTNKLLYKSLAELAEALGFDFIASNFKNEYLLRFVVAERLF